VLRRKALAEFIGTALLLIAVIGSGIAAQRLSPTDTGLQLLENAAATGAALVAIILAVGSVSGAHLNPVVSAADAWFGGLRPRELTAYVGAQVAGAAVGAVVANLMFSLPAVTLSTHVRSNPASTSFANPAVTLARTLSDTFAGIAPGAVVPFLVAQVVGAALACAVVRLLWPLVSDAAAVVVVPHEQEVGLG
jgi:glycerol uptake facilitator-like aquaporin